VIVDNARDLIAAQSVRYAAIDGRRVDLDSDVSANLIPWISMEWKSVFKWNGQGRMPEDERAKLGEMVKKAHDKGRKIRFWGLPLRATVWPELYGAGVDLLNLAVRRQAAGQDGSTQLAMHIFPLREADAIVLEEIRKR
jgi:hypothetical protein